MKGNGHTVLMFTSIFFLTLFLSYRHILLYIYMIFESTVKVCACHFSNTTNFLFETVVHREALLLLLLSLFYSSKDHEERYVSAVNTDNGK